MRDAARRELRRRLERADLGVGAADQTRDAGGAVVRTCCTDAVAGGHERRGGGLEQGAAFLDPAFIDQQRALGAIEMRGAPRRWTALRRTPRALEHVARFADRAVD